MKLAETRHAVLEYLCHHPDWSDGRIAEYAGVSRRTVFKYRHEMEGRAAATPTDPVSVALWHAKRQERKAMRPALRFQVLTRDGFRCCYCGAGANLGPLVVDHVHPVAAGGKTVIENLVTACEPCNQGKSATEGVEVPRAI